MRKGQQKIIEKAKKYGFTKDQIVILSDETRSVNQVQYLYNVWRITEGFSFDSVLKLQQANVHPHDLFWNPHMTYQTFMGLPDHIKDNPEILGYIHSIMQLIDKQIDVSEAVSYYERVSNGIPAKQMREYSELLSQIVFFNSIEKKKHLTRREFEDLATFCTVWCQGVTTAERKQTKRKEAKEEPSLCDIYRACSGQHNYHELDIIKALGYPKDAALDLHKKKKRIDELADDRKRFYDAFTEWGKTPPEIIDYHSKESQKEAEYIRDHMQISASVKADAYQIKCVISDSNRRINKPVAINFYSTTKVYIDSNGPCRKGREIYGHYQNQWKTTYLLYPDGRLYEKMQSRYIPACIRNFFRSIRTHHGEKLLQVILGLPAASGSYVIKDLWVEYLNRAMQDFPPIKWNECLGVYNRNQLMRGKYKETFGLDFNKLGVCRGYMYMKTIPYVDEKSKNILYNAITTGKLTGYSASGRKKAAVAMNVCYQYLMEKLDYFSDKEENITNSWRESDLPIDSEEIEIEIWDYLKTCIRNKQKISLRFQSVRKMINKNVDMVLEAANSRTPKIIIPKNTRYQKLHDVLPDEFEWITSKQRIITEGTLMRHCVASYADKVNRDECAIYHLFKDGKNYTIEFGLRGRVYEVLQIQSKADRGAPKEIWEYVEGFVKGIDIQKTA